MQIHTTRGKTTRVEVNIITPIDGLTFIIVTLVQKALICAHGSQRLENSSGLNADSCDRKPNRWDGNTAIDEGGGLKLLLSTVCA